jgi:hypothetical protein
MSIAGATSKPPAKSSPAAMSRGATAAGAGGEAVSVAGQGGTSDPARASGAAAIGGESGASSAGGGVVSSSTVPSAGCSKMTARPSQGKVMQGDRIYAFPTAYDGITPMPLLLALHAAGNPNTQLENLTDGTRLEANFVRVFPKSAGNAWVYDADIAKLKSIVDDVLGSYCIDTNRVFTTGHSSGAQMVVQLLCHGDLHFKAAAPVAASKYCSRVSPIPVLYIQGMMDAQRGGGNGIDVVNFFTSSNGCGSSTTAKFDVPGCTSSFDHMQVAPGCVAYDRCMEPTLRCSHNDNGYNGTDGHQHGWPCFASNAIADFFMSLQ